MLGRVVNHGEDAAHLGRQLVGQPGQDGRLLALIKLQDEEKNGVNQL